MSALTPDDARRMRGVLSRLLSDQDVERLAAVNALLTLLGRNGVSVVDLVPREGLASPMIPAVWNPKAARRAVHPGYGGNPQGVLCFNDELAGWLEGFDRYTSGGRPFWLSAFGGRPHSVTRKGSGSIHVKFCGISVLGSIQPDRIADLLRGTNDGLVPRILWAWPEKLPPQRVSSRVDMDQLEAAYQRLEMLGWGSDGFGAQAPIVLQLADDAADLFHEWEVANAASDGDGGPLYEAFVGKCSGAALRLALVSELTGWAFGGGAEPREVSKRSVAAAITWVEDYAKPMAARVYGDAAVPEVDRNAALLARYVRRTGLDRLNLRELRRTPHKSHLKPLQAKGALEDAIDLLENAGWVRADPHRDGDNPGQQRKDYRVNPKVLK